MYLAEQFVEGGFRVYAAALESSDVDGFRAAVVVKQVAGLETSSREVFRSERLAVAEGLNATDTLLMALCAGVVVAHQLREVQLSKGP